MHSYIVVLMLLAACGCSPRIALDAPKEPIMINMNVKIEHEIRVKVDKALDQLMANDSSIF
ncbi:MAG: YnbE family lipoprotein [Candidatus Symbiodolus clandestinus]